MTQAVVSPFPNYTEIAEFDLQAYVDNLTKGEKVSTFKNLGGYLQEKEADGMWLENHDSYPYSDEFMADYVTNHYVSFVERLFKENFHSHNSAVIVFTYESGRKRQVETIAGWMNVPRAYMLKMTMKQNRIPAAKVKEHLLVD